MNKNLVEYNDALERLKSNTPINISKNSKINNDTVALEAGRKRGSIKKNREIFSELIEDIKTAAKANTSKNIQMEIKTCKLKQKVTKYQDMYEKAINRELMYLERINELEKLLKKEGTLSINNKLYRQNLQ